jgi:hypothetical protein
MKAASLRLSLALVFLCSGFTAFGQKAPSQYFRKDSPRNPGSPGTPAAPAAPAAPQAPQAPKFKDLPVNSQFYFVSDTNRAYAWTKISADSAKNTKNGVTQAINGETPVRK